MILPSAIESFLRESERDYAVSEQPTWLLSEHSDSIWHIGVPQRGLEKTLTLRWDFLMPSGTLTDKRWTVALAQAKSLTCAQGSSPFSRGNLAMIPWFQRTLLSLIEYTAYTAPILLEKYGLRFLGEDDIYAYLELFKRAGVSGAGYWQARWEMSIKQMLAEPENTELIDRWLLTAPANLVRRIKRRSEDFTQTLGRSAERLSPQSLGVNEREQAAYLLHAMGIVEPDGCLNRVAVARAVNVNCRRLVGSRIFHAVLRIYETCMDYRSRDSRRSTCEELPNQRSRSAIEIFMSGSSGRSQNRTFGSIRSAVAASNHLVDFRNSAFSNADLDSLPMIVRGGPGGRTPTMPLDTALFIYDHMIAWAVNVGPHLITYVLELLTAVRRASGGHIPKPQRTHGPSFLDPNLRCYWEAAFRDHPPPRELSSLRLRGYAAQIRYWGRAERRGDGTNGILVQVRQHGLTVEDALLLHCCVLVGLTAAFSLRRRTEIYALDANCLVQDTRGGHLYFGLAKNGFEDQRPRLRRPIPNLLYRQLDQWIHLQSAILRASDNAPEYLTTRLFAGLPVLGPHLTNSYISLGLSAFCDWIEVPVDAKGRRWYVRCHECRRFGAMSFFRHNGYDASLPALAWMLGHRDISETWNYVKEELAGAELSAVEVALAHDAILAGNYGECSDDRKRLATVLQYHFGTDNLCTVSGDDLLEYLAMLREQGEFTVTPHTLRDRQGVRYIVMIHCRRARDGETR